jgi:hypothetical protein
MDGKEKDREEGLAVMELERSEGWNVLKRHIESELASCTEEQRAIELKGRPLQEIATDYISVTQKINGLTRVFEIVNEIKERKEQAETS